MEQDKKMQIEDFKKLIDFQKKNGRQIRVLGGRFHTPFLPSSGTSEFDGRYYRNFLASIVKPTADLGSASNGTYLDKFFCLCYSDYGEKHSSGYYADFGKRRENLILFEADRSLVERIAKQMKDRREMECLDNEDVKKEIERFKAGDGKANTLLELSLLYHKDNWDGRRTYHVEINGKEMHDWERPDRYYKEVGKLITPIRILPNNQG